MDGFVRKSELRYSVNENSSGFVKRLKYNDLVSPLHQVRSTSNSCGSRTDNGNPFSCLFFNFKNLVSDGRFVVPCKRFKGTYGNRVSDLPDDARPLTLNFLRTYPSANRGHDVFFLYLPCSFHKLTFRYEFYELGYRNSNGTCFNARSCRTLKTPFCLFHRKLWSITEFNFFKVFNPFLRTPFWNGNPLFYNLLLRHYSLPHPQCFLWNSFMDTFSSSLNIESLFISSSKST